MKARTITNSPIIGTSMTIDARKESTKTNKPFIVAQTR